MDCHEYTLDIDDICLHSEQCEAKPSTQIEYELTLDGIVVGNGAIGFRGNGIRSVSSTPSTEDEGENVVTVLTDDGQTFTFNVRNGSRGNGISSIDVEQSDVDAGASKLTVNFTDGDSKEFLVYNGHTGQAAGFGTPTISIDDTYGTPEASVTATGPDTAKVFHIDLKHLKGNGIESIDFSQSSVDGGTNTIVFNLSDGTKKTVQILNGSKGSTGDAGDKGTSVSKVEQTVKSTADSGTNVLKITLDDGTSSEFEVRNGSKGSTPTKSDLGLENVDNTSDMDKPVSTEMEQALETKVSKADYPFSVDADGRLNITYTEE